MTKTSKTNNIQQTVRATITVTATIHGALRTKSLIWGAKTPEPIATKFCIPGAVQDVITPANFGEDWLSGFVLVWRGVEFWPFPLTCFVAFKTHSHYRARV